MNYKRIQNREKLFNLLNATLLSLSNVTYKTHVYTYLENTHLQWAMIMWRWNLTFKEIGSIIFIKNIRVYAIARCHYSVSFVNTFTNTGNLFSHWWKAIWMYLL